MKQCIRQMHGTVELIPHLTSSIISIKCSLSFYPYLLTTIRGTIFDYDCVYGLCFVYGFYYNY